MRLRALPTVLPTITQKGMSAKCRQRGKITCDKGLRFKALAAGWSARDTRLESQGTGAAKCGLLHTCPCMLQTPIDCPALTAEPCPLVFT